MLVPALVINAKEKSKEKLQKLLEEGEKEFKANGAVSNAIVREQRKLKLFIEDSRSGLLLFKRNEMSMEISLQMSLQAIMLLLNLTTTPIVGGFQSVFNEDFTTQTTLIGNYTSTFLLASIMWSFRTSGFTYRDIKIEEKREFISFPAKLVLFLRSLLVSSIRIGCFIFFFAPNLGLFNLAAHWTAEQRSMDYESFPGSWDRECSEYDRTCREQRTWFANPNITFHYWDTTTKQPASIPYSELYRSNYQDQNKPSPPDFTAYTITNLTETYLVFWLIILLQALLIFVAKMILSSKFYSTRKTRKLQHVVECLHIPECFQDWHHDGGIPEEHRKRFWKVWMEYCVSIGIHFISNLILLIPIFIIGEIQEHLKSKRCSPQPIGLNPATRPSCRPSGPSSRRRKPTT